MIIMNYDEAIDYLYTRLPMFQRMGAPAYKPGLDTSLNLARAFGDPHRHYPSIHVAGTNGKGSTAHTLAAILQSAGYKVGLYTSPHLVDFRERMRVDGAMIPRERVVDFVERYKALGFDGAPSFFELTMVMAFEYFAAEHVDIAVIEVGLGGRLDSTNIISPDLCVITNISFDHTQFLGDTLPQIAAEKAGIIKPGVPVVIGESEGDVRRVFAEKAAAEGAPIRYADDEKRYASFDMTPQGIIYHDTPCGELLGALSGECQLKNTSTILTAVDALRSLGRDLPDEAVRRGFAEVCSLTGLAGRWMKISSHPMVVCDTGHNVGGWQYIAPQLDAAPGRKHLVIGFVNDKDIDHILDMMPRDARYYFTQASVQRALPSVELAAKAKEKGLHGEAFDSVDGAFAAAMEDASSGDTVFIGGSTFVVADFLASRDKA